MISIKTILLKKDVFPGKVTIGDTIASTIDETDELGYVVTSIRERDEYFTVCGVGMGIAKSVSNEHDLFVIFKREVISVWFV